MAPAAKKCWSLKPIRFIICTNVVARSKIENQEFEQLIAAVQVKADYYMRILNHLHQIKIFEEMK